MSRIIAASRFLYFGCMRRFVVTVLCSVAAGWSTGALAQTPHTWNVTSGVWQTGANWSGGSAPANDTTTNTAVFSGTANETSSLNADASIAGLVFSNAGTKTLQSDSSTARVLSVGASGITINSGAGTVTLGNASNPLALRVVGNQTWSNNSANAFTVLGSLQPSATSGTTALAIGGSGTTTFLATFANNGSGVLSLTKNDAGTLVLAGTNSYTGNSSVSAGTLQFGNGGTGGTVPVGLIAMSQTGNVTFNYGDNRSVATTITSAGAGSVLTQAGAGTLTFSGNQAAYQVVSNAGAGALTFASGTLAMGRSDITDYTTAFSTAPNATITINNTVAVVGQSFLSKSGSGGTLYLGNAVSVAHANLLVSGGALDIVGSLQGTLRAKRILFTGAADPVLQASGSYTPSALGQNQNNVGWFDNASDGGFAARSGPLTVNVGNGQTLTYQTGTFTSSGFIASGRTLVFGSETSDDVVTFQNPLNLAGSTQTIKVVGNSNPNNAAVLAGAISNGGIIKTGSGRLTLSASNSFTGKTSVNNGTLSITSDSNLGAAPASAVADQLTLNGGTLEYRDPGTGATLTTSTNRGVTIGSAGGALRVISGSGNPGLAITGAISGASTLAISGTLNGGLTATVQLNGSNSFSGAITVSGSGAVLGLGNINAVSNASSLTLGANTRLSPGAVVESGTATINNLTGSGVINASYGGTQNQSIVRTININTTTDGIFSGTIADGTLQRLIGIVKSGTATLALSGSNTYTGATTVSAGVLRLDSSNALPGGIGSTSGSSALTINGGVIGLGNGNFTRGLGTTASTVQITGGGGFAAYGATRTVNFGGNGTPTSLTWGAGNFMSAGSGTGIFILGTADATATVDFQNPIDLGSSVRTVQVGDGSAAIDARLSGVLSGVSAGNGLTKTGLGALDLTAANSFNGTLAVQNGVVRFTSLATGAGAQNLGAGTLVNLGVAATSAGEIDYRGSGGTLDKNITALGSGRNRIRNSGAGTLALTGTLTKNGTILELASGTFSVTGQITGSLANSDLYVNGATVTLTNSNNDYNGPTYVYGGGTLTLGTSNVIPNGSNLTLGATGTDTGSGTLVVGSSFDTVGGLVFGSGGGTVRMTASGTASAAQLAAPAGTIALTGGSLDLTGSGTTSGLYRLFAAQSVTGSFASIAGTNPAYQVVTTATTVDYQQRAVLGTLSVTNPAAAIITGGSTAFTYSVANAALSGGASLSFTGAGATNVGGSSSGTAEAGGTSGAVSGLVFTGTGVGAGQQGTFTVTAPTAYGTTTSTGTVSVTVLDHATSSLAESLLTNSTISLGTWNYATQTWETGTNSGLFTIYNIASSFGAGLTADLSLLSVSGAANGFSTNLNTYADIVGGSSGGYYVLADTSGWNASGMQTATFTIQMSDKTGMAGATASNTLTLTASVIVVPEPGSLTLAGIGIAACAWALRRRHWSH